LEDEGVVGVGVFEESQVGGWNLRDETGGARIRREGERGLGRRVERGSR
jgi:hypothetical protein